MKSLEEISEVVHGLTPSNSRAARIPTALGGARVAINDDWRGIIFIRIWLSNEKVTTFYR